MSNGRKCYDKDGNVRPCNDITGENSLEQARNYAKHLLNKLTKKKKTTKKTEKSDKTEMTKTTTGGGGKKTKLNPMKKETKTKKEKDFIKKNWKHLVMSGKGYSGGGKLKSRAIGGGRHQHD